MGQEPEGYISDLHLSVIQAIRQGLRVDPSMEALADSLQFPGDRSPATDEMEWVAYFPLSKIPTRFNAAFFQATVLIQVTCAARVANVRPDKDAMRPHTIAARISRAVGSRNIPIYSRNPDGSQGTYRGVFSVHEVAEAYMNPRSKSGSSIPGPRLEGVPLDSHAMILTIRGVTDARS